MTQTQALGAISNRRRAAFTLATATIPFVFFALLEAGLRLSGYGASYPLFEPVPGAEHLLVQNREVARRYFSNQERVPTGLGDTFPKEKGPGTYRIFVQGGSSAAGYPYYYGGSFSRMLAQRLQQTFPDRRIEVVNTSLAAVNSYTLLDFVPEIIAQQPDAVLIYAGHNEFYGALGIGSAESIGRNRFIVRAYLQLQTWRTAQLLRAGLAWIAGALSGRKAGQTPGATLMERMVGEREIAYRGPIYQAGLQQFRLNLRDLLEAYGSEGIPVFVGTIASNERDHPPFSTAPQENHDPARWNGRMREALTLLSERRAEEALRLLDLLAEGDSLAADVHFLRGRALDQMERPEEAREAYVKAKDRDRLRFRAPEDLNDIIREETAGAGSFVVDARRALSQNSRGGAIDGSLMLEHLHPNTEGYFIIADAFYQGLAAAGEIGNWTPVPIAEAREEMLVTPVDSLFGLFRVQQLKGSWPFKPPGTVWTDTLIARTPLQALTLRLFRDETSWFEATSELREMQVARGDMRAALLSTLAQIQQYPFLPGPYAEAGELLLRQGRAEESLVYYGAATEREESAAVRGVMGDIHAALGRNEPAKEAFQRAAKMDPDNPDYALKLGRSHALLGDTIAATEVLRKFLLRQPDDARVKRVLTALDAAR